ncbi:MAG: FkbM family methyltransferase [Candidatus Sulfotelmatobacter sp.]
MTSTLDVYSLIERIVPPPMARLLRGALLWKRRIQFRPYVLTRSVEGEPIPFYIGDATGKLWYGRSKVTSPELPFIRNNMISPGDLVFDVGSHHGFYAVYMARRAARVIAIEPNPHNMTLLQKNIALNCLNNVTVRQTAVGDSVGKIALLRDSNCGGVRSSSTETLPAIEVDLMPLDQLAREYGFPQFVKIDVEGFEGHVLRGASEVMRRRPKIAIEIHVDWVVRYGSSVREILDLLDLESYRVWVLRPKSQEVKQWSGENLTAILPPKFHLFLLPLH